MVIKQAIAVLEAEAEGILNLRDKLNGNFTRLVELIVASPGKVVISGIGKSGIIGRKIVATLNSTGTNALFLHPVEAMHGDLGMVAKEDIFIAISNSGETEELNILLPAISRIGCPVAAFTGNERSRLAELADFTIDVGTEKEACPMGLAPTTSTTAQLAMGDALAVVLINRKEFSSDDFRKFHPGGKLGQRLSAKVRELMLAGDRLPLVAPDTPMTEALRVIDHCRLGAGIVAEKEGALSGIITDGDIRHLLSKGKRLETLAAEEVMTKDPRRVEPETPVYDALNLMEQHQITVLPVTDADGGVVGILHLHDILGKGAFKFNGS